MSLLHFVMNYLQFFCGSITLQEKDKLFKLLVNI